jgi:hypothetical protein
MFDHLGHVICDRCGNPMKVASAEALPEVYRLEFACRGCDARVEVEWLRPSRRVQERFRA